MPLARAPLSLLRWWDPESDPGPDPSVRSFADPSRGSLTGQSDQPAGCGGRSLCPVRCRQSALGDAAAGGDDLLRSGGRELVGGHLDGDVQLAIAEHLHRLALANGAL